jgi:hypothetical protein
MSNRVKGKVRQKLDPAWDAAFRELDKHLAAAESQCKQLRRVRANWLKLRNQGMRWPGKQSDSHTGGQQHSV